MQTNQRPDGTLVIRYGSITDLNLVYIAIESETRSHLAAQRNAIPEIVELTGTRDANLEVTESYNIGVALRDLSNLNLTSPYSRKKLNIQIKPKGLLVHIPSLCGIDIKPVVEEIRRTRKDKQPYISEGVDTFFSAILVGSIYHGEQLPREIVPLEGLLRRN